MHDAISDWVVLYILKNYMFLGRLSFFAVNNHLDDDIFARASMQRAKKFPVQKTKGHARSRVFAGRRVVRE